MASTGSRVNFTSADEVSHIALDIGGTLIKMVFLSRSSNSSEDQKRPLKEECGDSNGCEDLHLLNGRLQFKIFDNRKLNECLEFISSMQFHSNGVRHHEDPHTDRNNIKATGGGSFKFADLFREKLGITLDMVDELKSLVDGANLLLKADHSEAFTYMDGRRHYLQIDHKDLYPFLLVNIGTGVTMCKVVGAGKFQLVDVTSMGGGTFLGLGRLLTKCKSFDELVELSRQGSNSVIDILARDIIGDIDYSSTGIDFPSATMVSNFGKPVSDNKDLEDYRPEDVAASLLRMISRIIGQTAHLNAFRFGMMNIFFAGSFLRHDHTMDAISKGVDCSSFGASKAMFLRHEGFLGALGTFTSYQNLGLDDLMTHQLVEEPRNARLKEEKFDGPVAGDVKKN